MTAFSESVVEDAALAWLDRLAWMVLHGPEIAAGTPNAERSDPNYRDVVFERRLRQSLVRLNPAAVKVLGEPTLIKIARELVETVS